MNTTESNKLIAEFMGWTIIKVQSALEQYQHPLIENLLYPENFQYHNDWKWLMPVVEKIDLSDGLNDEVVITISYRDCIIPHHEGEIRVERAASKIEAVYQAVVKFIQWHNTQPAQRLEYLRGELRAERISQGELVELKSLKEHIKEGDVELLEAAGVPEFPNTYNYTVSTTSIWSSFDFGTVQANSIEEARELAKAKLTENFAKANLALEHSDNCNGFNIEFNPDAIEVTIDPNH